MARTKTSTTPASATTSPDRANPAADPAANPATLTIGDGIAWLVFDAPGKRVNTLSQRLMGWFDEQLAALASQPLRGLVLRSGKPDTFIAGADIEELQQLTDRAQVRQLLRYGHDLFS